MSVILLDKKAMSGQLGSTFDSLVSHPLQTSAWGEAREKVGVRVVRFGVQNSSGAFVEVYQMTVHTLPRLPYFVGYIPRSDIPNEEFLTYLKAFCKKEKIIFVTFEPDRSDTPHENGNGGEDEDEDRKFHISSSLRPSKRPLFYTDTLEIDLTKSIEQLKQECAKKTRYNINLAEKNGVTVRELFGEEAFVVFSSLFFDTAKRKHFGGHSEAYHRAIWETMSKRGIAKMLVAYYQGKPLAVYELLCFGKKIYSVYSGSSPEHRELKAKNLLLFRAIEFGKAQGKELFDMWGIVGEHTNHKKASGTWGGFTDFKKGYGGKEVTFPGSYDFVVSPMLYFFYSLAAKVLRK